MRAWRTTFENARRAKPSPVHAGADWLGMGPEATGLQGDVVFVDRVARVMRDQFGNSTTFDRVERRMAGKPWYVVRDDDWSPPGDGWVEVPIPKEPAK